MLMVCWYITWCRSHVIIKHSAELSDIENETKNNSMVSECTIRQECVHHSKKIMNREKKSSWRKYFYYGSLEFATIGQFKELGLKTVKVTI